MRLVCTLTAPKTPARIAIEPKPNMLTQSMAARWAAMKSW